MIGATQLAKIPLGEVLHTTHVQVISVPKSVKYSALGAAGAKYHDVFVLQFKLVYAIRMAHPTFAHHCPLDV